MVSNENQTPTRKAPRVAKTPKSQQTSLTSFFTRKDPSKPTSQSRVLSNRRDDVCSSPLGNQASPCPSVREALDSDDLRELQLVEMARRNELMVPSPSSAAASRRVKAGPTSALPSVNDEDEDEPEAVVGFRRRLRKRGSAVYVESDDEDALTATPAASLNSSPARPAPKRARKLTSGDDGEWDPLATAEDPVLDEMDLDDVANLPISDDELMSQVTPVATPKASSIAHLKRTPQQQTKTASSTPSSQSRLAGFALPPNTVKSGSTFLSPLNSDKKAARVQKFKEKNDERYRWLLESKDQQQRTPDDEDYDPRTLHIPADAWSKFTPFEKQFWEIKCNHWDTVVFFKKGKFFELYEKDADIGHQHFDLKLTDRTNMRMVGVPESSFDHWAAQFLAKGYKVAKVDQTENAVGKAMRDRERTTTVKKSDDKIIRRELTCILTTGTLVDAGLLTNDMGTYCMAIKEELQADSSPAFGVAFVDTATAEFSLCSFEDDMERTRLETLIMQIKPKEVVLEKGQFSKSSMRLLKNNLQNLAINFLVPETEFWSAQTAADETRGRKYFGADDGGTAAWPEALQDAKPLALDAYGGLLFYLRSLMIDKQLVSAKNFHTYDPIRHGGSLILDGQTLINLEIFENSHDGTDTGTLHKLLNHCETPFGKRLFKKWVCHPLRSVAEINDRLDATEDLNRMVEQQDALKACMRKLPDLERLVSRIHSGNVRVREFLATLAAFRSIADLMRDMEPWLPALKSKRLANILNAGIPNSLIESMQYFDEAFDHHLAAKEDKIELHKGYDAVFDAACAGIDEVEAELNRHRQECEKKLKCTIKFKDMGKELFQMEIPKKITVPRDWQIKSQTAQVSRWWSKEGEDLVQQFVEARETKDAAMKDIKKRLCERFDATFDEWLAVVKRVAELDCLISLAKCQQAIGEPNCRPEFVESGVGSLEIDEMRHPCITTGPRSDFIPNDLHFGGRNKSNMILLTGPNMGGKSTLLRQTCIAVIMAQLGCHVPATRCRTTVFDRIFTRLGANDNILAGQSTFMVELAETCKIMREATPRSLVILDELGRGTSTFDGYAIAHSVLHHLITHVRCLGLFSTHYRMLTSEYAHNPLVAMKYMSFMTDEDKHEVTFLYKLTDGSCPKSYGMNVACMAGIPTEIVERAEAIASQFQKTKESMETIAHSEFGSSLGALATFALLNGPVVRKAGVGAQHVDKKAETSDLVRTVWRSLQNLK
ncbi:muts domain V-domain-containing protein [Geranomyces variabilis]|nr:muts domain V-domain-containing protein [Geranomyces variabilis]